MAVGIVKFLMSRSLISRNIRGVEGKDNARLLRKLVRKSKFMLVGLQESKLRSVDVRVIKRLWGVKDCNWRHVECSEEGGGGIITVGYSWAGDY